MAAAAGRPFAWVDDEITDLDRAWVLAHHRAEALLHRVDSLIGLTRADFAALEDWLRDPASNSPVRRPYRALSGRRRLGDSLADLRARQEPARTLRPLQWLSSLQPGRATHSMSPAFAFSYLARRARPEQMAKLDLSRWRTAVVGAETIDPAALSSFARLARVAGFSQRVFRPGYGLAEATLVVTVASRPDEGGLIQVDPESLRFGERPGSVEPPSSQMSPCPFGMAG